MYEGNGKKKKKVNFFLTPSIERFLFPPTQIALVHSFSPPPPLPIITSLFPLTTLPLTLLQLCFLLYHPPFTSSLLACHCIFFFLLFLGEVE
ncbi:hypothetical protein F4809DRAFT_543114 [Biscogniauxia mediterranea]|nr:hypothetical protein F4809DRAFT_543114 [Biscogniauxia mediterranea]